ncbi:N-acetylmannosamine-6-phosphate 2-epimerase [Psittacicella gerlachiana]|uniref:N-acylglucosamine-6-phosphate 2-epimerase n=1 Tax=Psittacicella gerlachiana TaxID=2028574 RepID=A0A3A1YN82_9GAMM|nr:putative N-acetylmannosamine-6-phosphate 2-epimerase [Psittacicella gerlachiana]RIY38926.1 N-acetylmannosamine-6-phosphate 2-epimerase [Psittacicella gerlachiana]
MKEQILGKLRNKLVVSVQPVDHGVLDKPEIVALLSQAAVNGGASGIRIEGVDNLLASRSHLSVPVIGIVKYDLDDSPVRITPFLEDVEQLAKAGANIIAFDGTDRKRPVSREDLVKAIHSYGCLAMADCSSREDGDYCAALGCEIIGTTLSGYTGGPIPEFADFELIEYFASKGYFVMAEGRLNTTEDVKKAVYAGADCVTVGTVLTRLEVMTEKFAKAASVTKD